MEQCKIRPSVTVLPVAIITKLSMIDYVGDPYSYANYGWISLSGEFPYLWLFVVSFFSFGRLVQKLVNG